MYIKKFHIVMCMVYARWKITIVITLFTEGNINTPTISKGKILPQGGLLVITPKGILFISRTDLVKSLQMPVNSSNTKKSPLLPQKTTPEFYGSFALSFSCSMLQLRTAVSTQFIKFIQLI